MPTMKHPDKESSRPFSALLRGARAAEGYKTQGSFADAIGMGRSTVNRWETGKTYPSTGELFMLELILGAQGALIAAWETETDGHYPELLDDLLASFTAVEEAFDRGWNTLEGKTAESQPDWRERIEHQLSRIREQVRWLTGEVQLVRHDSPTPSENPNTEVPERATPPTTGDTI